jgi:hypothetical protein
MKHPGLARLCGLSIGSGLNMLSINDSTPRASLRSRAVPVVALVTRRQRKRADQRVTITGIDCGIWGCHSHDGRVCTYRDRRGRSCRLASCTLHGVSFEGHPYCRRHGAAVRAVAAARGDAVSLPDLDDRTPSLINWIANDLDQAFRTLLVGATRAGEDVVADGNVQLTRDIVRQPRWERSWRIVDHTGLVLKICIYAGVGADALVHVRVADDDVFDGIPPWIRQRQHGEVSMTIDVAQRRAFYDVILASVSQALKCQSSFRREL